ncbi:Crp/Fnr family transcriptional regulator [Kovacikia minuta CCNUW1]|uniref:Crp/Fnr family transcriptional regulator n=1 Tax=Kovacikia minuta TaxID=2931930 RepID=UPI001CCB94C5|nr:Crp/Fnr family transcriptional regulator [Kovacikia minuta]UBF28830.1 Crp/Fnr family transcriptional regulator [Kovacikia minuta CCNUW1]
MLVEPLLEIKKLNRGETLFQEGDACEFVGLTLKGCLRMFFLKDGKELTLFFHPEHYPVGDYQSMRLQQPACFFCQAIENSEVLILNRQVIHVLESAPNGQQLMRLIVEFLAFRLRDRLLSLYRDTPEQRYLQLIETEPHLLQRVPQHYIASYLGIEPESLSRLKRRIYQQRIS